jgi:Immune Mapped Protein 2 (IMP2) N-terminal domain
MVGTSSSNDDDLNIASPTSTTAMLDRLAIADDKRPPPLLCEEPTEDSTSAADVGPVGCYLVYESNSGGRLMLQYSLGDIIPENAVGFWCCGPNQQIQPFKFTNHGGKSALISGIAGGDSNRRKYYSGWCQFLKLAYAKEGRVIQFQVTKKVSTMTTDTSTSLTPTFASQQQRLAQSQVTLSSGVEVDIYAYRTLDNQPYLLDLRSGLLDISQYNAVAVMPKHHAFLKGVKSIALSQFLELGNLAGASTMLSTGAGPRTMQKI